MLVYSGTLWLKSTPDEILGVVSNWLKTRQSIDISVAFLKKHNNQKKSTEGKRISTYRTSADNPFLECIKLTHRDSIVSGRQWTTEIGIFQESLGSAIKCSILLKTDESSTRVDAKIQPSVPLVIHDLIKKCSPTAQTIGTSIITLDNDDDLKAFGYEINYTERNYPFILISPTESGEYLVNVETVRYYLEGLAQVVVMPPSLDTFKMKDILGDQYTVWGGGINIIFQEAFLHGSRFSPTKRLIPDALTAIENSKNSREREILSVVTHRTNIPNSWEHISPEKVFEQIQKEERKHLREQSAQAGLSVEYVSYLEKNVVELEQKLSETESRANFHEDLFTQLDEENRVLRPLSDENRQLKYELDGLKYSISHMPAANSANTPDYIENTFKTISKYMSPKDSLFVISNLFADRIVVLDDAWESVEESSEFRQKKKVFDLLWNLSTKYWESLANGQGDTEARKVFGKNVYASNEGDMAGKTKATQESRTFTYKGKDIQMMKHLKYGVADSATETIRIHFEWIADEKKIVIGHCGPHLPHQ